MKIGQKIVMLDQAEYDKLLERDRWLYALEAAGVDNWDGWDEACSILEHWNKEDENEIRKETSSN